MIQVQEEKTLNITSPGVRQWKTVVRVSTLPELAQPHMDWRSWTRGKLNRSLFAGSLEPSVHPRPLAGSWQRVLWRLCANLTKLQRCSITKKRKDPKRNR